MHLKAFVNTFKPIMKAAVDICQDAPIWWVNVQFVDSTSCALKANALFFPDTGN